MKVDVNFDGGQGEGIKGLLQEKSRKKIVIYFSLRFSGQQIALLNVETIMR
jgi:hypothetical protein